MSDNPDDLPKDFIDFLQKLMKDADLNDKEGKSSIVGIKFILGPDGAPINPHPKKEKQEVPLDIEEEDDRYVIQTELPGDSPEEFHLSYPPNPVYPGESLLRISFGSKHKYVADIHLEPVDPKLTTTHLKNSVLEITLIKIPQTDSINSDSDNTKS